MKRTRLRNESLRNKSDCNRENVKQRKYVYPYLERKRKFEKTLLWKFNPLTTNVSHQIETS